MCNACWLHIKTPSMWTRNAYNENCYFITMHGKMRYEMNKNSQITNNYEMNKNNSQIVHSLLFQHRMLFQKCKVVLQRVRGVPWGILTNCLLHYESASTLAQVMAWCLAAPSHYLIQCWLIISKIPKYIFNVFFEIIIGLSFSAHCPLQDVAVISNV